MVFPLTSNTKGGDLRADAFLGALWGLSPKVMLVTEQSKR
jgi:hypothetical protein